MKKRSSNFFSVCGACLGAGLGLYTVSPWFELPLGQVGDILLIVSIICYALGSWRDRLKDKLSRGVRVVDPIQARFENTLIINKIAKPDINSRHYD